MAISAKGFGPGQQFDLGRAVRQAQRSAELEIDLYLDGLMTAENEKAQLHFHGPVGAVQTGSHARADVLQNISAEDRGALTHALTALREAIENAQELQDGQRMELIEVAAECEQMSLTGIGNNTKLRGMLNVLATTIQTIGSAQPAYAALKLAVAPLGILLP